MEPLLIEDLRRTCNASPAWEISGDALVGGMLYHPSPTGNERDQPQFVPKEMTVLSVCV